MDVTWDPNAPDAVLVSDDCGRGALALRAHPDDSDRRTVLLRFDLAVYALMTPPNDEALSHHPLSEHGLKELTWLGVVRDSTLVARLRPSWSRVAEMHLHPTHFILPLKECVVEVVAATVDLFRLDLSTHRAALGAIEPGHPL
ncbi:hypothetical protein [Phycicoccus flavus]|uniref:hypothetical protein n=1 Tax=Phycicoccus flavus TaxID=2502783 RepID=UPI000FF017DF|nr:hypothetical protein [Phycicoccus flavus]NHA70357.1 hypothetical protein [Phycicoccus flavus]